MLACANSLIYAHADYLDFMCPGWCALIDDDHQYFMPVPLKRKFGIAYAYQPLLIEQLGIFSSQSISNEITKLFLDRVVRMCSSVSLYLNYANPVAGARPRANFVIDLNAPFDAIQKRFKKNVVKKPLTLSLKFEESTPDELFSAYRKITLPKVPHLNEQILSQFELLCAVLFNANKAFVRKVVSPAGQTQAIGIFLSDGRRIYKLMSATGHEGRSSHANVLMIYEVIREYAGKNLLFDFCGSEVPGVQSFILEKFHAVNQPYYHFEYDGLSHTQKMGKYLINKVRGK